MKRGIACALAACLLVLTACSRQEGGSWVVCSRPEEEASSSSAFEEPAAEEEISGEAKMDGTEEEEEQMKLYLKVGGETFTVLLAQNEAAEALAELAEEEPVTIQMEDYAGFEKVGALGRSLPAEDRQMTTQAGDIMLYQGNQIVLFYGSNTWSYTPLGRIEDLTGWQEALGSGSVSVTFRAKEE